MVSKDTPISKPLSKHRTKLWYPEHSTPHWRNAVEKNKILEKLKAVLNHERYELIAGIVCIFLVFYGISCESTVTSMLGGPEKISRSELSAEIELYMAKAERKFADLNRQDEFKVLLFDKVLMWTATGVFNPIGILPAVFTVLGIGAVTDNVRRRRDEKSANKKKPTDTQ